MCLIVDAVVAAIESSVSHSLVSLMVAYSRISKKSHFVRAERLINNRFLISLPILFYATDT